MSEDCCDLYTDAVLDHALHPRNRGRLKRTTHEARAQDRMCGDEAVVYLRIERGVIGAVAFEGDACAVATASASLMTEALKGKTPAEARRLGVEVEAALYASPEGEHGLGALTAVRAYPVRIKCALLAWHTMMASLDQPLEPKMNIDRAVLTFAGFMVLISLTLSLVYSPWWLLLTAWVGIMLLQSGITRFCPIAHVFKRIGIKSGNAFR